MQLYIKTSLFIDLIEVLKVSAQLIYFLAYYLELNLTEMIFGVYKLSLHLNPNQLHYQAHIIAVCVLYQLLVHIHFPFSFSIYMYTSLYVSLSLSIYIYI